MDHLIHKVDEICENAEAERIVNRMKERTYQIPFPEESIRDVIAAENRKNLISGIQKMRR